MTLADDYDYDFWRESNQFFADMDAADREDEELERKERARYAPAYYALPGIGGEND